MMNEIKIRRSPTNTVQKRWMQEILRGSFTSKPQFTFGRSEPRARVVISTPFAKVLVAANQ